MNAIILCAGRAQRFFPEGAQRPKCLLPLTQDETILDRLLRQVSARGYQIVLGTGCGHEAVAARATRYDGVRCVFNPAYATTNSIVTLWQAREFVDNLTLIINGDLVVADAVFDLFDAEPSPQLLVKRLPVFDADTYRVIFNSAGRALDMGKELTAPPGSNCAAFLGISRVGSAHRFLAEIRALLDAGQSQTWPTTAYKRMATDVPVRVVDVGEALFFDVDTVEDYEEARRRLAEGML
ncbi:MAG: NTP transferase domain-containing protein [Abditibacteriales bacterium]|nr:NTP transferase domain-containing protein [Abditibacteriales bacterium]MDW8364260.1 NTP transferase domain-containing protein [Abditibacteriales bacterium]